LGQETRKEVRREKVSWQRAPAITKGTVSKGLRGTWGTRKSMQPVRRNKEKRVVCEKLRNIKANMKKVVTKKPDLGYFTPEISILINSTTRFFRMTESINHFLEIERIQGKEKSEGLQASVRDHLRQAKSEGPP